MSSLDNILVIKLSALGDVVQALGLLCAIKNHHKNEKITLLTTAPYVDLVMASGYIDDIIIDTRPKFLQLRSWFSLAKKLNNKKFKRVYDLQSNDRTLIYRKLFLKKPKWITTDKKTDLAFYRYQKVLSDAGIQNIEIDKMEWVTCDLSNFNLKNPYAVIVSGCAPSRPEKRWPTKQYAELCQSLLKQGIQPILIGTESEKEVIEEITTLCPKSLNLTGKTTFFDIICLAQNAEIAIGNDTGPMHFMGPTGCKTLVLFSGVSNPEHHKPLGDHVRTLQKENISDIKVEEVLAKIKTSFYN